MNYFTKVKKLILDSLKFFLENIEQRYVQIKNIVNDLNSTDTDKPISANIGNFLANRITNLSSKLGDLDSLHSNFQRPSSVVLALNKVIGFLDGKANMAHADPSGSNGIGDVDVYGHVMVSDRPDDYYVPGKVASTHSIKLIHDRIDELDNNLGQKKVLWSGGDGGMLMHEKQSVTFSQPLSGQRYGIVLCWSGFDPTSQKAVNTDWWYTFIPKWHLPGGGVHCTFTGHWNNVSKYVYIDDNKILGHQFNDDTSRTVGGITVNNNKSVLRHVWGI